MTDMLIKKGHINNDGIKEYIVFVLTLQYPSLPEKRNNAHGQNIFSPSTCGSEDKCNVIKLEK